MDVEMVNFCSLMLHGWYVAVVERLVKILCVGMFRLASCRYTRAVILRGGIPGVDKLKGEKRSKNGARGARRPSQIPLGRHSAVE